MPLLSYTGPLAGIILGAKVIIPSPVTESIAKEHSLFEISFPSYIMQFSKFVIAGKIIFFEIVNTIFEIAGVVPTDFCRGTKYIKK